MSQTLASVVSAISEAKQIVIVSHVNPDPDAYGSSCALGLALKRSGRNVTVVNEQGAIPRFFTIPGVAEVVSQPPTMSDETVVIACDCGALERVGDNFKLWVSKAKKLLNIDHHRSNSLFGSINLVEENASSTSEIVFDILTEFGRIHEKELIDVSVAEALLAGIMGDTGSFRYSATTAKTFLVAHKLVSIGASPFKVSQGLFGNSSVAAVKLQADALSRMQLFLDGRYALVSVTQEMLKQHSADLLDADVLAERARDIEGVIVAALIKHDVDIVRVSLRSKSSDVDVSAVAAHFGGGGHKAAAAFRWRRSASELLPLLEVELAKALGQSK